MTLAAAITTAFCLDLLLGDPRWLPHPVVAIGRLVHCLEGWLGRLPWRRLGGVVLTLTTLTVTGLLAWGLLKMTATWHPAVYWTTWMVLAATTLATRSLHGESAIVVAHLRQGRLLEARGTLAMLVSRDTSELNEEGVLRGALETVAENSSDGVIAPLFYLCLGGPVLALVYKAASTLDSMVGYRNDQYREFGWASARLDDLLNLLPARLTVLFMAGAAALTGLRPLATLRMAWRDGGKSKSPNAGYPMAAAAGALGVELGGPATYFGRREEKPTLGDPRRSLTVVVYDDLVRLHYGTAVLALLTGLAGVLLWQ
ncbi:MAG: cobalamin biosynthesis protein CobD [Desulfuromonadales bacterium GWD2_61_12]|nr:MAG: cobalamin biosynthesis protein CobD [Desulfuromonadales bacterium GWD2_61_12]